MVWKIRLLRKNKNAWRLRNNSTPHTMWFFVKPIGATNHRENLQFLPKKIRWILIGHILAPACGFLLLRLSTTSGSVALLKKQGQSTVFFRKLNRLLKQKCYRKIFSSTIFSKICLSLVLGIAQWEWYWKNLCSENM